MNEWIYVMLIGLGMDIFGVWMLASPLLRINLGNKKTLEKQAKDATEEYEKVKNQRGVTSDTAFPTWPAFVKLEAIVYQLRLRILNERILDRKTAVIALSIITIGFILQMMGNILQSLSFQK
ncbi:MAG: hypothetical protein ACT4NJ_06050 [Nitrosopumilaceae archaeon]